MALLFKSGSSRTSWWVEEFKRQAPKLDVRVWPETGNPDEIEFALVWLPEPGQLKSYRNLKAIFSLGAGVDHLFGDPELPKLPITRVVDINLTRRMTEYVVCQVLRHHRQQPEYEEQQRRSKWQELKQPAADQRAVGILGLGVLGADAAEKLLALGFNVLGWSRTRKTQPGVESFAGMAELPAFLGKTEILVCLLPLTPETRDILNARAFAMLPKGASFVNVGRGQHVVDDDLIAALDLDHLSHATLDVFRQEPLPADSTLWLNPKITISPHCASYTDPRTVIGQVVENIRRTKAGEPLQHTVDISRGY